VGNNGKQNRTVVTKPILSLRNLSENRKSLFFPYVGVSTSLLFTSCPSFVGTPEFFATVMSPISSDPQPKISYISFFVNKKKPPRCLAKKILKFLCPMPVNHQPLYRLSKKNVHAGQRTP